MTHSEARIVRAFLKSIIEVSIYEEFYTGGEGEFIDPEGPIRFCFLAGGEAIDVDEGAVALGESRGEGGFGSKCSLNE